MSPRSEEIAYLKGLMQDFPAHILPEDAKEAYNLIAVRYNVLEQAYQSFSTINRQSDVIGIRDSIGIIETVSKVHKFLFDRILHNAGEFRKTSDPHNGHIGFGGTRHQRYKSKFVGTTPAKIKSELIKAFSNLAYTPIDPIENAVRFYQHFVCIHPFYDANGRIGRIIVSTYLHFFDYYVQWGAFDGPNNTEFINKLNKCHNRMDSGFRFDEYFGYLLNFFKKYIIQVDELNDFKR